jgi:putative tricarboxylic transport membrane protein
MKGELFFNTFLFGVSIFLYYVTGTFKKLGTYAKSGPEFWPRIVLVLLICLSGILLIKNITSLVKAERTSKTEEATQGIIQEPYRFLLVVAASFAYAFGMGVLGFLLSTILFQMIFLSLLKIKRFASILFVSLPNTDMLYILFIRVLNMLLPAGVGVFRTFSLLFY